MSVVHNCLDTHLDVRCGSIYLLDYLLIANKELAACDLFYLASHHAFISALNTCLRKVDTSSVFYDYNRVDTRALIFKIAACDFNGLYDS